MKNKYSFLKLMVVLPLLAILIMCSPEKEQKTEAVQEKSQLKNEKIKNDPVLITGQVFNEHGDIVKGAEITEYDTLGRVISGSYSNSSGSFVLELQKQNTGKVKIGCSHDEYKTQVVVVDVKEKKAVSFRLEPKKPAQ